MSQYMPQMPQQMPMQGYGYPGQPMSMQQPMGMNQDTRDYVNKMRQQLDAFEQRFGQPPPMPQQPMQQPMIQQQTQQTNQIHPQQDTRIVLIPVSSYQEVEQYDVDLTGKTQWFIIEDTEEVYTKKFDIKAKRPGMVFKGAKLEPVSDTSAPQDAETPPQAPEQKPDPQPKQDEIDALRAEIAALNDKYKELEGKVNAKSDVVKHDGRKQPAADDTKHDEPPTAEPAASAPAKPDAGSVSGDNTNVESGDAAKPNNRKRDSAKAGNNANPTRPDSK